MRLTEKNEFGYILHIKSVDNSLGNEIAIVGKTADKLGQLEDIEEELGIDLITLFKALKQTYIYVKTNAGIEKNKGFNLCGLEMWSQIKLNANDYGKTWALTKEELL